MKKNLLRNKNSANYLIYLKQILFKIKNYKNKN